MNMNRTVLDASALLALLHAEDGSERVEYALPDSVIASVNLAEVFAALVDRGLSTFEVRDAIEGLALTVVPFDETRVIRSSRRQVTLLASPYRRELFTKTNSLAAGDC